MTRRIRILLLACLVPFAVIGCAETGTSRLTSKHSGFRSFASTSNVGRVQTVRTTAYTHTEADSLPYGKKNAAGTNLKYGKVRSAAADWSKYPVGTVFRIKGEPYYYEVDDYGSALVGTETIDIYKPNKSMMNQWGVRHVPIEIVRWGSYSKSLEILRPRQTKASHVREMVSALERKPVSS